TRGNGARGDPAPIDVDGDIRVRERLAEPARGHAAPRPDEDVLGIDHDPGDGPVDLAVGPGGGFDLDLLGSVYRAKVVSAERHVVRVPPVGAGGGSPGANDSSPRRALRHFAATFVAGRSLRANDPGVRRMVRPLAATFVAGWIAASERSRRGGSVSQRSGPKTFAARERLVGGAWGHPRCWPTARVLGIKA